MSTSRGKSLRPSGQAEIDAFLSKVAATPRARSGAGGRLIFAMDATASRQPTWDTACQIQGQMFSETATLGGLALQLCYYRGFGEFRASDWVQDSAGLIGLMSRVYCLGGHTQIARVLRHALAEHRRRKIDALVFVGDCMEENVDDLCALAGELGLLSVPLFVFHEGHDPVAATAFQQMARLTNGAYCRFDAGSAQQLKALLSAVAVYAAGGRRALQDLGDREGGVVKQLAHQVTKRNA